MLKYLGVKCHDTSNVCSVVRKDAYVEEKRRQVSHLAAVDESR